MIQSLCFALGVWVRSLFLPREAYWYGRHPLSLLVPALRSPRVGWESHEGRHGMLARLLSRWGTKLIVVSEGIAQRHVHKGVPREHITIIRNGVDILPCASPEATATTRNREGIGHDLPVALYAGSFSVYGWKGLDVFCAAAAEHEGPTQYLAVGGTREEAQKVLRGEGEGDAVSFLGRRPHNEIAVLLQAADVLVLPNKSGDVISETLTSPIKLFEYLASGKAVVVSDLPAIREIVDETCVVFVPPNDSHALALAVRDLAALPARREALGRAARARAMQYSWDARARAIVEALS